ncbi:MAG: ABC transporter permease [Acidiferrobacteraceae bacterium]|jgi:ABC-2 type transport system permease protein
MLRAILKKEILLTLRDIHALAVLFAMPVAFILVMSLALQDTDEGQDRKFDVAIRFVHSADRKAVGAEKLLSAKGFEIVDLADRTGQAREDGQRNYIAWLTVPAGFFDQFRNSGGVGERPIEVRFKATTPLALRQLLVSSLHQNIAAIALDRQLRFQTGDRRQREKLADRFFGRNLVLETTGKSRTSAVRPSSVQQSVPAWLIFSMFFVVIPIATTLIVEKQNGTHQRLMSIPVSGVKLLLGKLIPYLTINLVQTVLMFLVGIYLVPLFGGTGLTMPALAWPLIPISVSVGLVAIALALLIATIVRTTEQATTVGGVLNLLLAAVGGIMVPTYVMPEFMQKVAVYSPMNWGLDAYLTILLGEGGVVDVMPNIARLLVLALVLFSLAVANYRRVGA